MMGKRCVFNGLECKRVITGFMYNPSNFEVLFRVVKRVMFLHEINLRDILKDSGKFRPVSSPGGRVSERASRN